MRCNGCWNEMQLKDKVGTCRETWVCTNPECQVTTISLPAEKPSSKA